jgi:hypothetical protein
MIKTLSIVQPKEPTGSGWKHAAWWVKPKQLDLGYPVKAFEHISGLFCLSAVEVADEEGQPKLGPEYHLSISNMGNRCTSAEASFALNAFGLNDAKEDNHVPNGKVRNFWRPVADHLSGYECPCVDHEPAIKEDKGDFIWRGVTK